MANETKQISALFGKLCAQSFHQFPKSRQPLDATDEQGVYIIRSRSGKVLHVGRTPRAKDGIYQRLYDHLYGRSSFVYQYLDQDGSKLRNGYQYQYLAVSNSRQRALLEAYATAHLCPAHIGLGKE
jgi:hypothetical protein